MLKIIVLLISISFPNRGLSVGWKFSWKCLKGLVSEEEIENNLPILDKGDFSIPETEIISNRAYKRRGSDLFKILGVTRGFHGEKNIVYQRKYAWHDFRSFLSKKNSKKTGDITQDLRLFPVLMGVRKARYFGFQILTHKTGTVPTVEEINKAIEHFNKGLDSSSPEYIENKFYETEGPVLEKEVYVQNFSKNTSYPVAKSGRGFFHDISSHAMQGFFLNNEFFKLIQKRIRVWERLKVFLKKKYIGAVVKGSEDAILSTFAYDADHLAMAGMYLLRPEHSYMMKEVGHLLLDRNEKAGRLLYGKKTWEKIIGTYLDMRRDETVSSGSLRGADVVLYKGREFFSEVFKKVMGANAYEEFFSADMISYPGDYEDLSFDFLEKEKEVKEIQKNLTGKERETALRKNPITAPFFKRMDRLEILMK